MLMTTEERFAYADEIEHRALSVLANAVAFIDPRPYQPDFVMFREPEIWSIPHPNETPRYFEWYMAGVAVGVTIVSAAVALALVQT
jgi:hypothetical protein